MELNKFVDIIKEKIDLYFENESNIENIALYGDWGCGKSAVIDMIEKRFSKENYMFIKFNMWEYEILEQNFIITFLMDLTSKLSAYKSENKEIKIITMHIVNILLKRVTGINLYKNYKGIKKEIRGSKVFSLEDMDQWKYHENILKLINQLNNLFEKMDKKIVVVFDEIDRCNDMNIIKFMTCIKNIFFSIDSRKVFFLTALNKQHINYLFKSLGEDYTDKIFSLSYKVENNIDFDIELFNLECKNKLINSFFENVRLNFRKSKRIYQMVRAIKFEDELEEFAYFFSLYIKEKNITFLNSFSNKLNKYNSKDVYGMYENLLERIKFKIQELRRSSFTNKIKSDFDRINSEVDLLIYIKKEIFYNDIRNIDHEYISRINSGLFFEFKYKSKWIPLELAFLFKIVESKITKFEVFPKDIIQIEYYVSKVQKIIIETKIEMQTVLFDDSLFLLLDVLVEFEEYDDDDYIKLTKFLIKYLEETNLY